MGIVKSHTEYLSFNLPTRVGFLNITDRLQRAVRDSGVKEGLLLCNAMHITANVALLSVLRRTGGSKGLC